MKQSYTIDQLLGASFSCNCGREHSTCFSRMILEEDALTKLPALLAELERRHPYLICDTHTYDACGRQVCEILYAAGITYTITILESPAVGDLPADEEAFGRVCMAFPKDSDLVISIGSGTINDLGRYLSYITGLEFILVLTAPSMDGCVSGVAPLIQNHIKITFPAHAPLAMVGDLKILSQAPMKMLSAGVGDILGKYNCLTDWKLSAIVNGEYYCETIEQIMRSAIDKTMAAAQTLRQRRPEDIRTLTEGLVLSGMAMDFAGSSRPASGAEHHLSHFFEMMFLFDGIPAVLHGTKVGIGTVMALRLYNELAKMEKPDFEKLRNSVSARPDQAAWETEMKRVYREGAPMIIDLERKAKRNSPENLLRRLSAIEAHWEEIRALAQAAPRAEEIAQVLESLGAPTRPEQVGVDPTYIADGILYAKELRDRYTILQLLWDIDRLEEMKDM
ncbi:MAG: sn-glycerol-1-phosphate dehydrogenase [Lachnospiraceae bacterium]|nr:sn-glycerol-1-phosphate dehydrogenase [Lachnospiraceae bacterium]